MLAHGCQHSEHLLLASWRDEGPKAVLGVAERERELHSVRRLLRVDGTCNVKKNVKTQGEPNTTLSERTYRGPLGLQFAVLLHIQRQCPCCY